MTRVLALQVIEANLNRLREGIRAAEEALRYIPEAKGVFAALKQLRQRVGNREERLRKASGSELIGARQIERDAGRATADALEVERGSLLSLLSANFKRAQEAARNLEEYCKLLDETTVSADFKRIRFQLYAHEREARQLLESLTRRENVRKRVAAALSQFPLYLILDEANAQHQSPERLAGAFCRAGGRILQVRFKQWPARKLVKLTKKLKQEHPRLIVIVNDRADVALAAGADGVHLGAHDLSISDLGEMRERLIVGRTVRTLASAKREVKAGADYLALTAVFPTSTKPHEPVVGIPRLAEIAKASPIPCVAIGGVKPANFRKVLRAGADGFCAISALADPPEARSFLAKVREHSSKRKKR